MLNVPYGSGHLMVLLNVAALTWRTCRPTGGRAWVGVLPLCDPCTSPTASTSGSTRRGGRRHPDHLHVHVLPRWMGDTNFMTTAAETRVLNEPLAVTWAKLREAWPEG